MTDVLIPSVDHVARHCKGSESPGGQPAPTAFMRKENEQSPSVTWLEKTGAETREQQVAVARETFGLEMRSTARIAVLNVGAALEAVGTAATLSFVHTPIETNPAHAEIVGYDSAESDMIVADALASAILKVYPAKAT